MQYPLVSSYVLVYKKYEYLYNTLTSIMSQDYPNIELIVSDDGSGNFPYDEIKEFIDKNKKDNLKKVVINVNQTNQGTVKHFNKVLQMSSGEYYIGVASDDYFSNNLIISNLVNEFQRTNALLITARRRCVGEIDSASNMFPNEKQMSLIKELQPYHLYKLMTGINIISGANTYYSRKLFEEYGNFDERYILLEDYPKYLSLLRQGVKFHSIDLITINYNIGGISTNGVLHPQISRDAITAIETEIFPYIKNFKLFEKRRVNYQYFYFIKWEKMNRIQKIWFKLKYIDAVLFRLRLV